MHSSIISISLSPIEYSINYLELNLISPSWLRSTRFPASNILKRVNPVFATKFRWDETIGNWEEIHYFEELQGSDQNGFNYAFTIVERFERATKDEWTAFSTARRVKYCALIFTSVVVSSSYPNDICGAQATLTSKQLPTYLGSRCGST